MATKSKDDPALFDPACDPENPKLVTFDEITAATKRIRDHIIVTPCTKSHTTDLIKKGYEVWLKKEYLQHTGSFKERGARNALMMMTPEQKKIGAISASAGNHSQAMCFHGGQLGIPITVIMPTVTPIMKIQKCRKFGANIIVEGNSLAEAKKIALRMAYEKGALYINGYDHPDIIAGQGSLGLEILDQVADLDAVVIPVGGGSMIAGVGLVLKELNPSVQIIGVESVKTASFTKALKHGKPVETEIGPTLADGLAAACVGYNAFAISHNFIDKMVTVTEEWIAIAILRLVELEKCVVEGAGAVPMAALLSGKLSDLKAKKVVLILSGGNIDSTVLGRCLERGLAADGRLIKFKVEISDRPGGIAELLRLTSANQVSIKDVLQERAWVCTDVFSVRVTVICETRDYEHALQLKMAVEKVYPDNVRFADFPIPNSSKLQVPLF